MYICIYVRTSLSLSIYIYICIKYIVSEYAMVDIDCLRVANACRGSLVFSGRCGVQRFDNNAICR